MSNPLNIVDFDLSDVASSESYTSYDKVNKSMLLQFIRKNILEGGQCISMKSITDISGFNGNDRRDRFHVKQILEREFNNELIIFTISKKDPQVVLRSADLHSSGAIFHSSNEHNIVKQAAHIIRESVDVT